jgi:hypothetical protein
MLNDVNGTAWHALRYADKERLEWSTRDIDSAGACDAKGGDPRSFNVCGGTAYCCGVCIGRKPCFSRQGWMLEGCACSTNHLDGIWSQKRGTAVFRGAMSSADRAMLMRAAGAVPPSEQSLVDAVITKTPVGAPCKENRSKWCLGAPEEWMREMNVSVGAAISMAEQVEKYRYIVTVDGVGCADRFGALLGSSSAVVKQTSPYREYWYRDLVPGVHYIPVSSDFSNLTDAIVAAEADGGAAAKRMVLAANEIPKRYLSHSAKLAYMRALFEKYTARQRLHGDCAVPSNTVPFKEWRRAHML